MSNKLQTYEGGHSYSGYRSSKTQCGTGGSREPAVPVKGVIATRAIEAPKLNVGQVARASQLSR